MKVIKPYIKEIVFYEPTSAMGGSMWTPEQEIEKVGRTCYKSEDQIGPGTAEKFVRARRKTHHHAMLEFGMARVTIIADRGLTHELVRHRLASFAQESTRYCNYSKGKFDGEITVIKQPGLETEEQQKLWHETMWFIEATYLSLLKQGVKPEIARSVLPIGLKSEINVAANLREWRHIFVMRCDKPAHPIIRGIMLEVLRVFNDEMPAIYEDLAERFLK
jgi:thymidylate synthase (FAD)